MMDLDEFERILKQQAQGQQVPAIDQPGPATSERAAEEPVADAHPTADDTPKLPSLTTMVDQEVTIDGVARNAFLGAVVMRDNGTPVYLDGLDEWEASTSHRRISVTGVLRVRKLAPDPVVGPDGGVSHGAYGNDYVLESPTWTIVPG